MGLGRRDERAVLEVAHRALCSYKICGFCREKMEALGDLWNREMARPDSSSFNSIALDVVRMDKGTARSPRARQN